VKLADSKDLPKVETITGKMSTRWGTGTVVIPAPIEVDELMRRVPKGKLVTVNEIRSELARKHGATIGCPITTGIFALIAARAAEEDESEGKKRVTPYWRTLKATGEINPKYPGGLAKQASRLRSEGHKVVTKGRRSFVADYERKLVKWCCSILMLLVAAMSASCRQPATVDEAEIDPAVVARVQYPTTPGSYRLGEWQYTYEVRSEGTRSERRVGTLLRRGAVVRGSSGDVKETPFGRFVYFDTMWESGWLNTRTYDRRVFDDDGEPLEEVREFLEGVRKRGETD